MIASCALLLTACAREAPPALSAPEPPVSSMPDPLEPEPAPPGDAPVMPAFPEEEPPASGPESTIDPSKEAARLNADGSSRELNASGPETTNNAGAEPPDSGATDPAAAGSLRQAGALDSGRIELELLHLINKEREQNGVPVLGMQDSMRWAAQIRAAEIVEQMSHTRPDGTPYHTAFDEAGFEYAGKWHGENVSCIYFPTGAYDEDGAARKIFDTLSQSSGHYQNMIGENFAQAGIGAYVAANEDTVTVGSAQLFAGL